jgi:hypothetical protein
MTTISNETAFYAAKELATILPKKDSVVSYSIGYQRLATLSKKHRSFLNQKFINLPLAFIHEAQKAFLADLSENSYNAFKKSTIIKF